MDVTLKINLERVGPELDPHAVVEALANVVMSNSVRRGGAIAVASPTGGRFPGAPTFYLVTDVEVVGVTGD